ncbi:hypothetical protein [Neogemmobacter tilapiae]|uniref:Uncharacterized protein n=1 Tax=Neogemmobacter tilapiae TaxID=875041 RepID=A0A918TWB4_9RHOB|nr:hypothetical protein [Gemmobacter tilapiae]GHC66102.1 hypothetical protein GCM10007315_33490 [Gemmobacter tilapiae]
MKRRDTFGFDAMLGLFQVIWAFDRSTTPPKPKMLVCLCWEEGWFLRINTADRFRPCVAVLKADNPWLDHDSHVECGLLVWDEYELEEAMKNRRNPLGFLHDKHRSQILAHLEAAPYIRAADKVKLRSLLG